MIHKIKIQCLLSAQSVVSCERSEITFGWMKRGLIVVERKSAVKVARLTNELKVF